MAQEQELTLKANPLIAAKGLCIYPSYLNEESISLHHQ